MGFDANEIKIKRNIIKVVKVKGKGKKGLIIWKIFLFYFSF